VNLDDEIPFSDCLSSELEQSDCCYGVVLRYGLKRQAHFIEIREIGEISRCSPVYKTIIIPIYLILACSVGL
jgi:hypothetical protein